MQAENSADSLVGSTAGNFQIERLIGRGGMSSVYLATDKDLERSVALKVPHSRLLDSASFVKRFRREAKAMARLRHPNIVQIYSVGSHEEIPFFAMEYIRGECLEKIIRRKGSLSLGVALDYISQVARAIEYAHRKGVIHRDIKPANILVDPSGRVFVTDFGVSKMLLAEATQDTVGFVGTPQYMSPEQCGQGTLDHRTDIYSMGAVLFEMLTGKPAFSSDSPAEAIKKQLFDMPEFPSELEDKIPEKVRAVISKMLAKDPENRYPDVRSFLHDLKRLEAEFENPTIACSAAKTELLNIPAKNRAVPKTATKKGRRRAVVALVCLLVGCVGAVSLAFRWNNENSSALNAAGNLLSKNAVSAAFLPEQAGPAAPAATEPVAEPAVDAPLRAEPAIPPASEATILTKPDAKTEPAPQWARVEVGSTPPGAEVFLDSEPQGATPLTLSEVSPGRHILAMKLEGYPDLSKEVTADAGAPLEVFHDFEAARKALIPKGSLVIDSEPSGAVVYMNGREKGRTRLEIRELRSADYNIELRLEGYEPLQKRISLLPDEKLRISLNLIEKPKFGSLRVSSHPGAAEVLLNGVKKGLTPLVLHKLPVGEYEVTLRRKGYRPYEQSIVCEKDSTATVEASLEMTPKFAALKSGIAGDKHAELGDLARAAAAYDRALALDPQSTAYRKKLNRVRRSLLKKEVQHLLSSYEFAYDSENAELLASLLDESRPEFLSDQVENAKRLFSEFDNIDMALSEPKFRFEGPREIAVELRLSIDADFAETGLSAKLLNTNRTLVLRRNRESDRETGWKICEIR